MEHTRGSDDGVGTVEDVFRRAAFNWALSTKKMVDASAMLGDHTRVAFAALVDIEYARDALDRLFIPSVSKVPAGYSDHNSNLSSQSVKDCVSGLAERMSVASQLQAKVDEIVDAPQIVRTPRPQPITVIDFFPPEKQSHRGTNLSAPVYSKNGKMRWADADCPDCPSKAHERCRRPDGAFMEKPHKARTEVWLK